MSYLNNDSNKFMEAWFKYVLSILMRNTEIKCLSVKEALLRNSCKSNAFTLHPSFPSAADESMYERMRHWHTLFLPVCELDAALG